MTLALLWKYRSETALALLLVVAFGLWRSREHALVARGVAWEKYRVADSILAAERPKLARVDTLVQHDTRTVTRTIARVDSLRDTLLVHLTDTVLVKEFVRAADSTARACTELSNDCAAFRASALTTIHALQTKLAAAPAIQVKSCAVSNVVAVLGGVAGTWLVVRR